MRTIDADDLLQKGIKVTVFGVTDTDVLNRMMSAFREAVITAPTVEVLKTEPAKYGKWEPWDIYGFEETYECTACGESVTMIDGESPISNGFKYCPYCGAKMDERKEE